MEGEVAVEAVAAVEGEDLANFLLYASAYGPSLGANSNRRRYRDRSGFLGISQNSAEGR